MSIRAYLQTAKKILNKEPVCIPSRYSDFLHSTEGIELLNRFHLPIDQPLIVEDLAILFNQDHPSLFTTFDLKVALIATILFPLRQTVGSCFATATAIYIQRNHPKALLLDLFEMFYKGGIRRYLHGQELFAPTCPYPIESTPACPHPLLRRWEYTLASFSDYHRLFTQANLSKAIGVHPNIQGGIGDFLKTTIQEKLDQTNQILEKLDREYSIIQQSQQYTNHRMPSIQNDHGHRLHREILHYQTQGQFFATVLNILLPFINDLLQKEFIEIFNPYIGEKDLTNHVFEDRQAGFSLIYKARRTHIKGWHLIKNKHEFFTALFAFFTDLERQIEELPEIRRYNKEFSQVLIQLHHFIQTIDFEEFVLRSGPVWEYSSGGSFKTLLQGYFMITQEIPEKTCSPSSPTDLLIFLIDVIKAMPPRLTEPMKRNKNQGLFMYSPTHAFFLQPGHSLFQKSWSNDQLSYIWVRDQLLVPSKKIWENATISLEIQRLFLKKLELHEKVQPEQTPLLLPFLLKIAHLYPKKLPLIEHLTFLHYPIVPSLFFADTNWPHYLFAFVVSPLTREIDLYRMSSDQKTVYPMTEWRKYLDGSSKEKWGVFTDPHLFLPKEPHRSIFL